MSPSRSVAGAHGSWLSKWSGRYVLRKSGVIGSWNHQGKPIPTYAATPMAGLGQCPARDRRALPSPPALLTRNGLDPRVTGLLHTSDTTMPAQH